MDKVIIDRFWSKVNKTDTCWLWTGAPNGHGYGSFKINGKEYKAHRLMWIIRHGYITEIEDTDSRGTCVCHSCDNRLCVNPDHLFLGSHKRNMADMVDKGRGRALKGDNHPNSKLTFKQAEEIRELHPTLSHRELAANYGVCPRTVGKILLGLSYQRE